MGLETKALDTNLQVLRIRRILLLFVRRGSFQASGGLAGNTELERTVYRYWGMLGKGTFDNEAVVQGAP